MFEKVLIPTDLSAESDKIFDFALALKGLKEVVAVHTFAASEYELIKEQKTEVEEAVQAHGIAPSSVEFRHMPQELKRKEEKLAEKGKKLIAAGIKFKTIVDEGDMVDMKIVELAEKEDASLILVGSHGKSAWEEILYGSVSEKVARKARVPVLVVKFDLFEKTSPELLAENLFKKVLFPADLKPGTDKVLDLLQLIKPQTVAVLHSAQQHELEGDEAATRKKKLENIYKELVAAGAEAEIVQRYGDILDDILKASEKMTSIVMASTGKGVLKEWLTGSISINVVRKASVPVILVHQQDVAY